MERGARRSDMFVHRHHDFFFGGLAHLGYRFIVEVGGGVAGGQGQVDRGHGEPCALYAAAIRADPRCSADSLGGALGDAANWLEKTERWSTNIFTPSAHYARPLVVRKALPSQSLMHS